MGKQEEERLEMTNGMEGRRQEREVSPAAGAQDAPEIGGKGKGGGFFRVRFVFLSAWFIDKLKLRGLANDRFRQVE